MKQILSLALALLPCLAWAQYPSNGNQKITLGEQTTADGLIYRGVLADTGIITPSSDTSAYIILDTVNHRFYNYNRATNVWSVAGGGTAVTTFSGGSTGLTPNTATSGAVTLGGTLAVANGGTGATSLTPNNYLIRTNSSGILDTSIVYETGGRVGIGITNLNSLLNLNGNYTGAGLQAFEMTRSGVSRDSARFSITNGTNGGGVFIPTFLGISNFKSGTLTIGSFLIGMPQEDDSSDDVAWRIDGQRKNETIMTNGSIVDFCTLNNIKMRIMASGNVGIGTTSPAAQFHTTGGVRFAGLASITDLRTDADGDLFNGSDFNLKNSIDTINFGLKEVLKLKPVQFNWNDISRNLNEYKNLGFIAQDVMDVIPNAASSMGDGDMQVDYNAIVATLTKAIQEQQALIKALEQRIINLENK